MKALVVSLTVLVFIVGLFFGTSYILNQKSSAPNSLQAFLPVIKAPVSFDLALDSPDNQSISFSPSLVVSGTTSPNTPVIISTDKDDAEVDAGRNGAFSKAVSLSLGLNHIKVSAFDSNGNAKVIDREIYYSKDSL